MDNEIMVERPEYLMDIARWKDKDDLIKIVTGVRRCGKSTLFLLFQNHLRQEGIDERQIISINLELADNERLLEWKALHDYVVSLTMPDKMSYVFLDEIQMVADFPRAVNSLRLKKNIDLYITGSNASMLSRDIQNILGGRTIEIQMLPLSFKEYLSAFPEAERGALDKIFTEYLTHGSFPQLLSFRSASRGYDERAWHVYMDSLYNTIIVKDILSRQGIQEFSKLRRVIRFLFSNIGSETSLNNMGAVINSDLKGGQSERNIHTQTIASYLDNLLDGYVFYETRPSYLRGKERLRSNAKFYAVDTGLRYFLLGGSSPDDAGHILENIVYLELRRRGYSVEFGKVGGSEIDFVARKGGGLVEYYQVAQTVLDSAVLARELKPLNAVKDNYPKYLLSRDYDTSVYNGIRHQNVLQWLSGT